MFRKSGFASFSISVLAFFFAVSPTSAQVESGLHARPVITQNIDEGQQAVLNGHTRTEANAENDRGESRDDFKLEHMLLQLRRSPEQEQALQQFIDELNRNGSPNFHQWITAQEFGQRFGLSKQDLDKITDWLESHGFTVNVVYPSGMVIDFSGNVEQLRRVFKIEIHNLDVDGEKHVANMNDPQIPAALAPAIVGIVSLNDFKPHSLHKMRKRRGNSTFDSLGATYALVPSDLATIYNLKPLFSAGYSGQGQTIALIGDSNVFRPSDWTTFRSKFGLSSYTSGSFSTIHPAPSSGANNCRNPGVVDPNDAEAILDAEWASAAAPNASIELVSCADTTITFGGLIALENLVNATTTPPAVISVSYGQCETHNGVPANAAYSSVYQQAVTEGVSVFVAAGDSGGAACDDGNSRATHGVGVNALSSTPYNVAVGGTDFSDTSSGTNSSYWNSTNASTLTSAMSYIPEIPWNDSCAGMLITKHLGYTTPYGSNGFCNSSAGEFLRTTIAGGGGPSGCATGTPSTSGVVSGTCQGWPKPSWQSVLGNPSDGVRDTPDISLFAANGLWSHYYIFCWSDTEDGGAPCKGNPSDWSGAGGTSFASSIMAGIQALVNQKTGDRQGNPNPVYYQLAATEYGSGGSTSCNSSNGAAAAGACIFYDVTQADTDVNCTGRMNCFLPSGRDGVLSTSDHSYETAFSSAAGWDFATGIGSINAANLANNWPSSTSNFTLSAFPTSLSVTQGTSGGTTITVNPLNGFSGSVSLSASGLPNGVSAAFSPNIATTASTLTMTASGTATTGTVTVTITGTTGILTNTTTLTLTVIAAQDFALSASPGSVSIVQGNSGGSTITITPLNGFSGSVTLSASGLPSGVTASFSPTVAGMSTMTLTASITATTGTVPVTITGMSSGLTHMTGVTLTVTPAPDFALTASPSGVSIVQGTSGGGTITVTPLNGFSGSVSLSASGLPSGVAASFGTNPTTGMSTMTLTASITATTGTVPVTIKGMSGSLTHATGVTLTVIAAPDFALTASPGSVSITQGTFAGVISTITVTPQFGFSGSVSLSASGLPSGVTASFSQNPATGASTMTFTASNTATTGTVPLIIAGTSGSLTHTTGITLTVSAPPPPPAVWLDQDLGPVGVAGNASLTNGTFTVQASGQFIWSTADSFNFAHQSWSGDGTIVARVVSVQGGPSSESGVMIRETLTADSTMAYTAYSGSTAIYSINRASPGAFVSFTNTSAVTLPYWVKVVRSGSALSSYSSPDGVTWNQVGSNQTIIMAPNVYIGLAVSSNDNTKLATATFDNVSISSAGTPAPTISSLSVTTGAIGSQVVISGTGFGASQNSSAVMLNGAQATVGIWSDTSITITIPPGATTGPLTVLVAPSMNSSNPVTFTVTP